MDGEVGQALQVLPVVPWTLAALSLVLLVGLLVPPGGPRPGDRPGGPSPVAHPVVAAVAAVLAVLAVVVARTGPDGALRNPVGALVVGLGWPLLLLLPALLRRPRGTGAADVRPAVPVAAALVALLVLPVDAAAPDLVGTAVAAYLLLCAVVAVAAGRQVLAGRVEVLGLLAAWAARGPAPVRWAAPRGALAVLAVVLGGAWAERYERAASWREGLPGASDTAALLVAAVLVAAAGALLLHRAAGDAAAPALLPLALATAVAGAVRRALISAQVLADQAGLGVPGVDPDPLGVVGGQALALALVAAGGALGAAVLARRLGEGAARLPGLGVLLALSAVSAAVVLQP